MFRPKLAFVALVAVALGGAVAALSPVADAQAEDATCRLCHPEVRTAATRAEEPPGFAGAHPGVACVDCHTALYDWDPEELEALESGSAGGPGEAARARRPGMPDRMPDPGLAAPRERAPLMKRAPGTNLWGPRTPVRRGAPAGPPPGRTFPSRDR